MGGGCGRRAEGARGEQGKQRPLCVRLKSARRSRSGQPSPRPGAPALPSGCLPPSPRGCAPPSAGPVTPASALPRRGRTRRPRHAAHNEGTGGGGHAGLKGAQGAGPGGQGRERCPACRGETYKAHQGSKRAPARPAPLLSPAPCWEPSPAGPADHSTASHTWDRPAADQDSTRGRGMYQGAASRAWVVRGSVELPPHPLPPARSPTPS